MMKWEKPVLSVLGISKTKGSKFKALNGVPVFSGDQDFVSPAQYVSANGEDVSSGVEPGSGHSSSSSNES
jgi:hypothetical protein